MTITGFEARSVETPIGSIFVWLGGSGPPVLLLHGFPETSLMWRDVAPLLASDFTIVAADLPGYGESDPPPNDRLLSGMSKRRMGDALLAMMHLLGHERFSIVGHDRGGRVAYRSALDHPQAVTRLAVLDVVPTFEVWERADDRTMLAFWPFTLLAQPAPLPERLIGAAPEAIVDDAARNWDTTETVFPPEVRYAYVKALGEPDCIHSICEEYRAAARIDREHDRSDVEAGRRIACPLLALWSGKGGLSKWYADAGGPLGIWSRWAEDVQGRPVEAGHFFPEEIPGETAALLRAFLKA